MIGIPIQSTPLSSTVIILMLETKKVRQRLCMLCWSKLQKQSSPYLMQALRSTLPMRRARQLCITRRGVERGEIAMMLLAKGADCLRKDDKGYTPLRLAAYHSNWGAFALFEQECSRRRGQEKQAQRE